MRNKLFNSKFFITMLYHTWLFALTQVVADIDGTVTHDEFGSAISLDSIGRNLAKGEIKISQIFSERSKANLSTMSIG